MTRYFHVTSVLNRASITEHGLDWTRMGAAPGIAGSVTRERDGIFLCREDADVDFFVRINGTGSSVDVWAIDATDIATGDLLMNDGEGDFHYLPRAIPPKQLTLIRRDLPAVRGR